jgi:hypothetical protein
MKFCARRRRAAFFFQRFSLVECLRFDMSAAARLFTHQRTAVSCCEWARARASYGLDQLEPLLLRFDEKTIRQAADALVSAGMREAGYPYVIRQECTAPEADAVGNRVIDGAPFPSRMPALIAVGDFEFGDRPILCFL